MSIAGEAPVVIKQVDYLSLDSITEALRGQDAVVDSTFSRSAETANLMIDACIAAGVYRYLPPEFGADPYNELITALPFFAHKAVTLKHLLKRKAALTDRASFTWTAVACGAFLDPPLADGSLGVDVRHKRGIVFSSDGFKYEDLVGPWSTLTDVGRATAQVLLHPEETADRVVFISSVNTSQSNILSLAKEAIPGQWDISTIDIKQKYEEAWAKVKAGDYSWDTLLGLAQYQCVAPDMNGPWKKDDNDLLRVKKMSNDEIKELMRRIAAGDNYD